MIRIPHSSKAFLIIMFSNVCWGMSSHSALDLAPQKGYFFLEDISGWGQEVKEKGKSSPACSAYSPINLNLAELSKDTESDSSSCSREKEENLDTLDLKNFIFNAIISRCISAFPKKILRDRAGKIIFIKDTIKELEKYEKTAIAREKISWKIKRIIKKYSDIREDLYTLMHHKIYSIDLPKHD